MMDAKIVETVLGVDCRTFALEGTEVTMGGGQANISTVQSVSEKHAVLQRIDGQWYIYDNKSEEGVYLNGVKLEPEKFVLLCSGNNITLCPPHLTSVQYEYRCDGSSSSSKRQKTNRAKRKKSKLDTESSENASIPRPSSADVSNSDSDISPELSLRERVALRLGNAVKSADKDDKRGSPFSRIDAITNGVNRRPRRTQLSLSRLCEYDEESKSTIVAITRRRLVELENLEDRCDEQERELRKQKAKLKTLMEKELSCPICFDVYTKAVTLQCSHTFCSQCLLKWRKTSMCCPVCRSSIKNQCKAATIDNVISALTEEIGPEYEDNKENLNVLQMQN